MSARSGVDAARPSGARRVFGNTILLSTGQGVGLVSMAIWTIAVARYIGPEHYGFYAVAQAMVSILVIVVGLGLDQIMTRDVARDPALARPYLRRFVVLKFVSGAAVLGGYLALGLGADPTSLQVWVLVIVTALGGVQALNALVMSLLYAQDAMGSYVAAQSTNFVATMVTGLVVIAFDGSFQTVLVFSLVASLIQLVLSFGAAIRRLPPPGPAPEVPPLTALFRRSAPFALIALITVMHGNLLVILLEATGSSSASVGRFAAAQRIAMVFMIVPGMLAQVLVPAMSRAYAEAADALGGMFERAYRYVLLLSLPAAAALAVIAPQLLDRLYGDDYAAAGDALRILTLVLGSAVVYVVGPALSAMDRQGLVARIHGANLVLVALVAYVLIPQYGAEGAAWALVAGAVAASVVYTRLMFRRLSLQFPVAWTLKAIAAAAVVGGSCLAASEHAHMVVVLLLVAPLAFLASLVALRTLDASEWRYVRGVVLPARWRAG